MKGNSKPLLKFMEGSDTRFVIPVYQRNYDWKKENCVQLFRDLIKVVEEDRASHFFGSIVSVSEGSDNIIIDGQQRLTTVSLLLLALRDLVASGKVECTRDKLADKITNDYLVDQWQPEDKKIKLKPVKDDMNAFNRLFDDSKEWIESSKVTQNYRLFSKMIEESGVEAYAFFEAIKKLIVIDITLESGDNPQLIFESLNSTGLDLSEADKIRNYVLMGLHTDDQNRFYEKYWNRIEEHTGYEVSEFIRQYLTFKQSKWPNISKVYQAFKAYAPQTGLEIEPILDDMLSYARIYGEISAGSYGSYDCRMALTRLVRLETSVANPFLFGVIGMAKAGDLGEKDLLRILAALETYLYRRLVCEVPTNSLNKTFANLANEARRLAGEDEDFAGAVIYALLRKPGTARMPDDGEFEEKIRSKDFYNMRQKNRIYTFDRIENGFTYENVNVPAMMLRDEHGLTVEHVMPQTLTQSWRKELGEDYERIHSQWRHRIANLTLTAYNSSYSNKLFKDKRDMEDGFAASPLWLNGWIKEQDSWGEEQLKAREDLMVKRFMEIWPTPASTFEPAQNTEDEHGLDEDFDFTGTKPSAYTLLGSKHSVKTWKDAAAEVLSEIYDLDPAAMESLIGKEAFPSAYFGHGKGDEHGWREVGPDFYAYLSTSTSTKMALLDAVFETVGLASGDLIFTIRPEAVE